MTTVSLIFAAIFGVIGIVIFLVARAKQDAKAMLVVAVMAIGCMAILINLLVQRSAAKSDPGKVSDVRAFEHAPWLVVVRHVELFNILDLIPSHGGSSMPWAVDRVEVFDLASHKETARFLMENETVSIVGAIGDRLIINTERHGAQLRHLPDGAPLGSIDGIVPELQKTDARLAQITTATFDSTSSCIKAQDSNAWYLVHPRTLKVVTSTSCTDGYAESKLVEFTHAPDDLPNGAHSTGPSRQTASYQGKVIGAPGGYIDPWLCLDARTGLPVELSPKSVLVCHGRSIAKAGYSDASKLTAVSLDGRESWTYNLEKQPLRLVTREGDTLMVMDGTGALFVLDATHGEVKDHFSL